MKKNALSYRLLLSLLLTALALSLIPLLAVGRYAVPCADDFSYGTMTHLSFVETGSFIQTVAAAGRTAANAYRVWQGTFSAIFLMALQPSVFGEGYYFLTPVIMLAALLAGSFMLCVTVGDRVFGLEKRLGGIVGAVAAMLSIQLIPSPVQGLFWYNGAIYYVFFHGLALLALALGIRLVLDGGLGRLILLSLLAFVLGGCNYVTALSCAILGAAGLLLLPLCGRRGWKRLILPFLMLLLSFGLSFLAPGNAVRQASVQHEPQALRAIVLSFASGAEFGLRWLSPPLLGSLMFLAPLFWHSLAGCRFRFRFPALVSLFSYCLLSAMFCPPLYALGSNGDKRTLNIIYFTYLLLLIFNLLYWLGWLSMRRGRTEAQPILRARPVLIAASLCLLCYGVGLFTGGYTSTMALGLLRSGDCVEYAACAQRRLELLNDPNARDVALEPYPCVPYLLYFDDITPDAADWRNVAVAEYYGKDSVVLDTAGFNAGERLTP